MVTVSTIRQLNLSPKCRIVPVASSLIRKIIILKCQLKVSNQLRVIISSIAARPQIQKTINRYSITFKPQINKISLLTSSISIITVRPTVGQLYPRGVKY